MTRRFIAAAVLALSLATAQAQSEKVFLNNHPFQGKISGLPDSYLIQATTVFEMLGLSVTIPENAVSVELGGDNLEVLWMDGVAMIKARDLAQHFHGSYNYSQQLGAVDIYARGSQDSKTAAHAAPSSGGSSSASTAPRPSTDPAPDGPTEMSSQEMAVVSELNKARTDPGQYVSYLQKLRASYRGNTMTRFDGRQMDTKEGVAAVDEAIKALQSQRPVPALKASGGLALAARSQVKDQGQMGMTGHEGTDGSTPLERARRFGRPRSTVGENIAYGFPHPRDIVVCLIVDDDVEDRGHRHNIFDSQYRCVGVSIGQHRSRFSMMCVMDFADGFTRVPPAKG